MISGWIFVALVTGGLLGFQSGSERERLKSRDIKVEKVEPELYGPNAHLKLMKMCARECRRAGGILKNYSSIEGECSCTYKKRRRK